jgi:hypothetical protein
LIDSKLKYGALELDDIIGLYLTAEDKDKEVFILAELTVSDAETIIEVLKDLKIYEQRRIQKCANCGKMFINFGSNRLPAICNICRKEF